MAVYRWITRPYWQLHGVQVLEKELSDLVWTTAAKIARQDVKPSFVASRLEPESRGKYKDNWDLLVET
jgi:hypothetical protein